MTRFTDSPFEQMMTKKPEGGGKNSRPSSVLPKDHPCYGCGNAGQTCVGICQKQLNQYLLERRKKK